MDSKSVDLEVSNIRSQSVAEQVSLMIWSSIVSVTSAFKNVSLNVDVKSNSIYIKIELRVWARLKKMQKLRDIWLKRAEEESKDFIPTGWKAFIYYEVRDEG